MMRLGSFLSLSVNLVSMEKAPFGLRSPLNVTASAPLPIWAPLQKSYSSQLATIYGSLSRSLGYLSQKKKKEKKV